MEGPIHADKVVSYYFTNLMKWVGGGEQCVTHRGCMVGEQEAVQEKQKMTQWEINWRFVLTALKEHF